MSIKKVNLNIKNDNGAQSEEQVKDDESKQKEQKREDDIENVELFDPYDLEPHPKNIEIYGSDDNDDIEMLIESIEKLKQLEPIVLGIKHDKKYRILSGHRRWKALCEIKKRAKTEEEAEAVKVRCIRKQLGSELAEKEALIEFNRQRKKNYEQIYHEVKLLEEIYAEQAKLRMRIGKPLDPSADPQQGMGEPGKTKEKLAAATGMKETQLRLLMRIGDRCTTEKKKENQKLYENAKNIMNELRVGEISIDAADKKLAVLDAALNEEFPDWKREKLADLAKEVKTQKISPNQASEKLKKIKAANEDESSKKETKIELPEGEFDVMVADPQDINDARELKIHVHNAACFLWADEKNLEERIELLKHWGFTRKAIAVCNTKKQGGTWFYGGAEFVLLGIKGDMTPPKLDPTEGDGKIANLFFDRDLTRDPAVTYTRPVHKSIVVYEMAEQMFPGRVYCDPFRRNEREGWLQPNVIEVEEEVEE